MHNFTLIPRWINSSINKYGKYTIFHTTQLIYNLQSRDLLNQRQIIGNEHSINLEKRWTYYTGHHSTYING